MNNIKKNRMSYQSRSWKTSCTIMVKEKKFQELVRRIKGAKETKWNLLNKIHLLWAFRSVIVAFSLFNIDISCHCTFCNVLSNFMKLS